MNILDTLENLVNQTAFFSLSVGNYIMILVACVFLYLATVSYTHLQEKLKFKLVENVLIALCVGNVIQKVCTRKYLYKVF